MTDVNGGMKAYGEALFSLTEELGVTERVLDDVKTLSEAIKKSPEYLGMLDSPALSREERLGLIDRSFSSLDKNLVNMAKLLCERRLCYALPRALDAFVSVYETSRGIERVEVISAIPLSPLQCARLKAKLEGITKKQIIISNTHDPSLLGGMKLRYMGIQLDGSVKSKLDGFEKRLSELVI
ncbi:MAG: ATP synthase F1 subunit delta [Clostridia bacterium]|nr:ATP synthase F1 subunit delta [Clostridia bacterium]